MDTLKSLIGLKNTKQPFQNVAPKPLSNTNAKRMDELLVEFATKGSTLEEFRALETKAGWAHLPEEMIRQQGRKLKGYMNIEPVSGRIVSSRATSPTLNQSMNLESFPPGETFPMIPYHSTVQIPAPQTFRVLGKSRKNRKNRRSGKSRRKSRS